MRLFAIVILSTILTLTTTYIAAISWEFANETRTRCVANATAGYCVDIGGNRGSK